MRNRERELPWSALVALSLCGLLGSPKAALAQDALQRVSLAEALQAFVENSLELKIARSETDGLAGAARQSRAYFNPELAFARDNIGHEGTPHWEQTVHLIQQVEWPGRTAARGRAVDHAIRVGTAQFLADSIRLAFEVRETYARAWLAEAIQVTVRRTAQVIQGVTKDAEARLAAGDISAYEARRLRLERVQAELELAEAILQVRDARRTLAALIAPGTGTEEIGPSEGLEGVPPMVTRETALGSLSGRPDIRAAAAEVDAAHAAVQVAKSYSLPEPTVGLGYRRDYGGTSGLSIELGVPLPVFDQGSGNQRQANAELSAAEYRLHLRQRWSRYDIVTTFDRYSASRGLLDAQVPNLVDDGEALLASATAAYAENEMTLLELLDAASAFRQAQLSALSLRAEAWIAYHDLIRAMASTPENETCVG